MRILFILLLIFFPLSAFAQDDTAFWSEVRVQWGQYANPENVRLIRGDMNCDGVEDQVGARVNLDNPDGPFFDILVFTQIDGNPYSETVSLPYSGSSEHFGICGIVPREGRLPVCEQC